MIRERYPQLKLSKRKHAIRLQQRVGKRSCSPIISFILEKKRYEWDRNRKAREEAVTKGKYGTLVVTLQEILRENEKLIKQEKEKQQRWYERKCYRSNILCRWRKIGKGRNRKGQHFM